MDQSIIQQPFNPSQIRTRKGPQNKTIRYVPTSEYIRILNQAAESGAWNFEIVEYRVLDEEVLVLGKLTIDAIIKTAFGGSTITRHKESGKPVSVANDLKSAASDALKRCAMRLGIGLELYSQQPDESATSDMSQKPFTPRIVHTRASNATDKQIAAVHAMAKKLNISSQEINHRAKREFGRVVNNLDKRAASQLIQSLQDELNNSKKEVPRGNTGVRPATAP